MPIEMQIIKLKSQLVVLQNIAKHIPAFLTAYKFCWFYKYIKNTLFGILKWTCCNANACQQICANTQTNKREIITYNIKIFDYLFKCRADNNISICWHLFSPTRPPVTSYMTRECVHNLFQNTQMSCILKHLEKNFCQLNNKRAVECANLFFVLVIDVFSF